jgi:hypothetical protein
MGLITSNFKKSIIDDMLSSIQSNSAYYYAFAASPNEWTGNTVPAETSDDYSVNFYNNWTMLFGKKLTNTDIFPVARKITWASNNVYAKYNNTTNALANSDFYVMTTPSETGGYYHIYKCIDNANGAVSTSKPDLVQQSSFTKADGYTWRYICSISDKVYKRFATDSYIPIYANAAITESAYDYSGIDIVNIHDAGSGYTVFHQGTVQSTVNSTVIQISNSASSSLNYYSNSAVYFYANSHASQFANVISSSSNGSGIFITVSPQVNTTLIEPTTTSYYIGPRVVFNTDGIEQPIARAIVNPNTYSISSIQIIDTGYGITRANVSVVTSAYALASANTTTAANVSCIPPPAGGHGSNPVNELGIKGISINFKFANGENNSIPTNVKYNKIGIIKNPYNVAANGTKSATAYTSNTFNGLINAEPGTAVTFTVSDTITGANSGAKAIVAFSNTSVLKLVGDKTFVNGEIIYDTSNNQTTITVNAASTADIYTKDLYPLYVQNIDTTERSNTQIESFRIIIQV